MPEAAWLWDGAQARIVWANAAGIGFFGGASLFDLIDRPFDAQEPGVREILRLSRSLRHGQVETVLLHFPSTGVSRPLSCRCMVHALADGRPGILAVARQRGAEETGRVAADIAAAFDLLPSAAMLIGRDGGVRHVNAAALMMLDAGQRASLAALFGDAAFAGQLLARIEAAGTAVVNRELVVRLGARDIRITARRLGLEGNEASFALLLLDDVTERRAAERKLAGSSTTAPDITPAAPKPEITARPIALSEADAAAFEKIGETLKNDIRHVEPRREPPHPPQALEMPPRRKLPRIPDQVRLPLENRAEAVLVAKDGELLFANPAAARFFAYETGEDVINDASLAARFGQLGQPLPYCEITSLNGQTVEASMQMTVIPWLGGPARQFVLEKSGSPQAGRADLKLAPASSRTPGEAQDADTRLLPERPQPADSDQELRAILDTAADGIITLDRETRIHTFSAGAEAIFGYPMAEVAGRPFADLLAPESRAVVRDYLAALQGPGLASVLNDGREVTAHVRQGGAVPLFLTIGRLQAPRSQAAFCAVVRDITQWKKTEAELREAKERAEATSRQKSEFLASVSHELRTPLNAIMGFSEVMRLGRFGDIGNEKYRGYVQDIHASGAHLLSLINDLLDLSKVEAGKLELNFTAVDLGEATDYAVRMLNEQAAAARVVLRKSLPPDLPAVVADLRAMRQVMINLVSNAIKFTNPGGQVMISAQLMASGELKLRIRDSGIGMDEEQLRGALEPFGRIATEGRDAPGTGLGLPLTRALIEANRASLVLTSEPDKGTLAEITFPAPRVLAD